eukprot:TRINITY_DN11725_c0_g1_i1.p1 TRINITY_DN11725_c0_g1~~TRINITY_DN11725_c0_g1_i1.p1  ORF type:complete len:124 (+),score=9.07 TRINITY_DN11725_c0_g1_i1:528-899(+)
MYLKNNIVDKLRILSIRYCTCHLDEMYTLDSFISDFVVEADFPLQDLSLIGLDVLPKTVIDICKTHYTSLTFLDLEACYKLQMNQNVISENINWLNNIKYLGAKLTNLDINFQEFLPNLLIYT